MLIDVCEKYYCAFLDDFTRFKEFEPFPSDQRNFIACQKSIADSLNQEFVNLDYSTLEVDKIAASMAYDLKIVSKI